MVFPREQAFAQVGEEELVSQSAHLLLSPSRVSVSLISPDSASSVPGQAVGAPGRWGTLWGAASWASSPPPLAGVGADVQAGQRLLHKKPRSGNPVIFLGPAGVCGGSSASCSSSLREGEPSHRVKRIVDKASEPRRFISRVLWIRNFMVLSLKAGRLN